MSNFYSGNNVETFLFNYDFLFGSMLVKSQKGYLLRVDGQIGLWSSFNKGVIAGTLWLFNIAMV